MDPEVVEEAVEVTEAETPVTKATSDQRIILGNTGQNVLGLAIGAVATFAAQVIMTNALGDGPTAWSPSRPSSHSSPPPPRASAWTSPTCGWWRSWSAATSRPAPRPGASVGRDRHGRLGSVRRARRRSCLAVARAARSSVTRPDAAVPAFRAAAVTIPFAALAFTYMGATRGLKIMRYTLYSQWIAQPIGWIVFTLGVLGGLGRRRPGAARRRSAPSWALASRSRSTGGRRSSGGSLRERHAARASPRSTPGRCCGSAPCAPRRPCSRS